MTNEREAEVLDPTITARQVLIAARALIAKGWTQNQYARDADGNGVSPGSPDATCWCASGAIHAAVNPRDLDTVDPAEVEARRTLERVLRLEGGITSVITLNDAQGTTQADMLAAFDRGIELLGGE